MSSSGSSSAPSPSPPASPEASFHELPSTERLVGYFVAAKRSLTSTSHVWRANELVTNSRALIEETAVLHARNAFVQQGVDEQVGTLQAIKDGIADVDEYAALAFKTTISSLDAANDRLQRTLRSLRETVVDTSLQQRHADVNDEESGDQAALERSTRDEAKTLYSFIDEDTHISVLNSLHGLIDSFNGARADLNEEIATFGSSLQTIADTLQDGTVSASGSGPSGRTLYDEPPPTIPELFHGLEGHAAEMASSLQSLVSHYDLCVTALKHTEGGGQAAKVAVQAEELKGTPGAEESLYRKTIPEPISDEERTQMLTVLGNDALQVEDVTAELKDHAAEMEAPYDALMKHTNAARASNNGLKSALRVLHQVSTALPGYLEASKSFKGLWQIIQSEILAKTQELMELADFYEGFLVSYSRVTEEVERRKNANSQMKKTASKAQRELNKLHEAENEARDLFLQDVGEHLPRDLWPSVGQRAPRWQVAPTDL